jgi:DnaJ-class molecular chaperone
MFTEKYIKCLSCNGTGELFDESDFSYACHDCHGLGFYLKEKQ